MSKYSFKVYLNDGSSMKITPSGMQDTDLFDMDGFVVNQNGYLGLYKVLALELNIDSSSIKEVTILRNKKAVEFSLIINNEYLQPVLNDLHKKKVQGYGPYQIEVMTVSTKNQAYLEMKKYVFENLRRDYQKFLKEVYNYNNEFSKLLYRYGASYSHGAYKEDEQRNLIELEKRISIELSIYKNFRGLCRSRKRYEQNIKTNISRNKTTNIQITEHINQTPIYKLERNVKKEIDTYNQDDENEEFLDEEEYLNMFGENNGYKGL